MSFIHFGILLVLFATVMEGSGQACLKKSSLTAHRTVWVTSGILLLFLQGIVYTYALQWLDISTAYPLGALSFVVVTVLSSCFLSETITLKRWCGVGFIMIGCMLIAL